MRDVSAWLRGLGLGKYAGVFEENEVDFDSLPYLTETMLEQIGMPIGPRAKVLAAISELALSRPARAIIPAQAPANIGSSNDPRPAERRQITVMFCDLVGSTELASRLDPEDFKSVMQSYQKACREVVERYEGHVSQYHGDGVEIYFGWPAAHEDSAERAVRAGLEVVEAVRAIAGPERLSVRVGISTGIVVISETGFGDPSIPSSAVGDTPYVAARLQALAPTNSVIIAEATDRLVSPRFDREDLGPLNLKGIAEPVYAFRVRHVREDSSRFQPAPAVALTPLVGRRTELALLQQRWSDAKAGEGQVIYVSGVPGIGKSRIVHELKQWIGGEAHFSFRFQCLPQHMQSAFFPIIQQFLRLGCLLPEDSDGAKIKKIERLLSRATRYLKEAVPFVADMLSIPTEPKYAPPAMSAVQVKVQTLFVLADLLAILATRQPVICVLEDAQWIDPSTQELLDLVVRQIEKKRILLVVTHRTEYQAPSGGQSHVSALTLSRLTQRDVKKLARLAIKQKIVLAEITQGIIDRSDCIPLFVEELARGVMVSDSRGTRGASGVGIDRSTNWSIPASLRDSLVARLDRSPQGRMVAQIAAVVGREFTYDTLLSVARLRKFELDSTLLHLQQSDIIQQIDKVWPARYVFKHALLRDAAYESLLKSSRREIHAKVGETFEKESPEIVEDQPELVAFHYSMAGIPEQAARYWILGGRRARSRSANLEATVQLQKALEFVAMLPETQERLATELEIHLSLGLCHIAIRGYSADDTRKSFERARGLSIKIGDPRKEIQAIFGLWGHYWMIARHDQAVELSEMLIAKARDLDDPIALTVGHRSLGSTLFTLGDFVRAKSHLERAVGMRQAVASDSPSLFLSFAVDPRIASQLILGWNLWILGYPEQALRNALEALGQAVEQANPYTLAFAHYVASAVRLLRGEFRDSLVHSTRALEIATEHRINLYALYSQFARGCALAKIGQKETALLEVREAVKEADRKNLAHMRGFMLAWLATVQMEGGDPEAALSTIDNALKQINDVAGRAFEADLRRLRADVLLLVRPAAVDEAERGYSEAIAIAQNQHARSLELRATIALAHFLRRQNRNDEASGCLAAIRGWFTEGFDTADLMEAKELLKAIGPAPAT